MSDINAAPSSTEPALPMTDAERASLPDWVKNGQPPAQEAGPATTGETSGIPVIPSATGNAATDAAAPSTSTTAAPASADTAASTTASPNGDAPAVAAAGETVSADASAVTAMSPSNVADSGDAGIAAADAGNADALPAVGQSASDTASSALPASLDGVTVADALRAEIAVLQQQLADEQANVAKWQMAYNQATAARAAGAPAPAHRWISLLEVKLNALEHDARDELLDVARQLREAL